MSFRALRAVVAATLATVGITVVVTAGGQPASAAVQVAGTLVSTPPTRVLDTRIGLGGSVLGPGQTLHLSVLGAGPVPETGVSAVVLNVTVVDPTSSGYVTVWPDGVARPTASNLNFVKGQTVPNLVIATVGTDGDVDFFNSGGSTQLLADVSGYYLSGSATGAGTYVSLTPARLLDTRSHLGGSAPKGGGVVQLQVSGRGGVPASGVSAVVLNVTVTNPSSNGYVTVWADKTPRPTASNLNFVKGHTVPNLVFAPLGADGKVDLFNSAGTTQLIADVSGYFRSGTPSAPGAFVSTAPTRFLDTRSNHGGSAPGSGGIVHLQVDRRSPLPAKHVVAVVLNVTVTAPTTGGYITVWADGQAQPTASNLNYVRGQTVPNLVVAPVGADGLVDLYNSGGRTQLIADVAGYFVADTTPPGPVTGVTATATGTSVALAWTNPGDADFAGVQIRRAVGPTAPTLTTGTLAGSTIGSTNSFTDSGLTAGTQYSYALFAFDNAGNFATAVSPSAVTTAQPDTTPPGPVTGVVESATATTVALSWTNPTDSDFAGVLIVRKPGATPPASPTDGTTVATTTAAVTTYTDRGLTPSTQYSYALFAFDTSTNYAAAATVSASTVALDTTPPGPVTGLTATPNQLTVQLSWTNPNNSDFGGVTVVRKPGATPPTSPTDGTVVATTTAPVTEFTDVGQTSGTDVGLAANTQYSYAVFTFNTSQTVNTTPVTASATTPASASAPGPVIQAPASTVTADALPTVQIDGVAWSQVIVGNTVYVGGSFANARPAGVALGGTGSVARTDMLAYNLQTGALISSFAPVFNGQVRALAVSPDGTRLYAAGDFTTVNGSVHNRIAAFDATTGALISGFTAGVDAGVHAVVATNSGVYVGGLFANANGSPRTRLAEFTTAGALSTWNALPGGADSTVNALVLTPDGTELVVGGAFQHLDGVTVNGLGAVDATTGASVNWAANQTVYAYGVNAAIESLATDGNAVFGSAYNFHNGTGNLEGAFSADPDTGAINWVEDCHGDTYDVFPVNGVVYTVSHAHYCANDINTTGNTWGNLTPEVQKYSMAFTAQPTGVLLQDSLHDTEGYPNHAGVAAPSIIDWFPDFTTGTYTGQNQAAWTVTGNSQYLLEGGEFPTVNGTPQQGLVRFAVRPIAPALQGPRITGSHFEPVSPLPVTSTTVQLNFNANWDRDDQTLYYKIVRNSNTANPIWTGSLDSQWWTATASSPTPTVSFTDTGLMPNTTYRYRLYVTDADGNTVAGDTVSVTTNP